MTTLAITPNWKNKSAKFKGTVAAGEHVSVTIQNENGEGGEFIEDVSALRLRVVDPCNGRTLAIFPEPVPEGETPEEWDSDLSPLRCTLNLNTVQMLRAVPPAANVPLLFVLDDYENKTLYFKEQFPVEHWPRLRGEEEPTDLDNYKDLIAEFDERLTAAEQTVADAAANAQSAANSASAAAASAATAATAATDAQAGAIASKNAAQTAANDAASAKTAAEDAQDAAEDAQEAAETAQGKAQEYAEAAAKSAAAFVVDDTFFVEGAAADAKAVGEANQDLITRIETVQDNLDAETTARETLAAAVGDNRQNLAAEIARAQTAEQSLDSRKADKTTTYTKDEVDAAVAAATPSDYDSVKARLAAAEGKIPTQASAQNKLADKAFVNSSVATATATFRGTSDASTQAAFETWLDGLTADANDYVFWRTTDTAGNAVFKRYKYNGAEWEWEFDLNNSSFTAEQWAAISSGITSGLVAKLGALPTAEALATALAGKQDVLTFDNAPTAGSNNPVKSGGIWSMIWGALASLPTGFASLYDWCVAQLAGKVPTSRTVNGKALTGNVSLTAADVNALPTTGGTVNGNIWLGEGGYILSSDVGGCIISSEGQYITFPTTAGTLALAAIHPTAGHLAALDANGNPTDSGVKASDKLDASSASAPFSSDSSVSYAVGSHCTYNGKLYKCVVATTGGTWVAASWAEDTMTDPDAVLDVTAQDQLRVVAKDGTLLWAQGYDLASTSSATLACDAVNNFTFADGATTQAFTLPTAPSGKVGDFGLDIDNSANTGAATMTLTGLDTTFSVVVPEGESLTDMLAIAAGELARFYVTMTTFRVNNLPTWHIVKQVVENGGATA